MIDAAKYRVSNGPLTAVRQLAERNAEDLQSRRNQRCNRPDQAEYAGRVEKRFERFEGLIDTVRGNWITPQDGEAVVARTRELENEDYGHPEAEKNLAEIRQLLRRLSDRLDAHRMIEGHPELAAELRAIVERVGRIESEIGR